MKENSAIDRLAEAWDYCSNYEAKVAEAVEFLRDHLTEPPEFGIVFGSGLGGIGDAIDLDETIGFAEIPNFPRPTVEGHAGRLLVGRLESVPVVAFQGRTHYYEVADEPFNAGILRVVFPTHVLAGLGVPNYFTTNAVGGLNPSFEVGDLMVIESHFSLLPNPLAGRVKDFRRVDSGKPERFQPMNDAYDPVFREWLLEAGSEYGEHVRAGTLMVTSGPSFETEVECMAFRDGFGVDAVGMSTAPEVTVARNRGMRVVGFSSITNIVDEHGKNAATHEEVVQMLESEALKDRLTTTVRRFFQIYREKTGSG
ncbi:MAG: purine-nucleoside phosphorylase [Promethearchaeota archaeon]